MKTLIEKEFVEKKGKPQKFCLTEKGLELAKELSKGEEKMNGNIIEEEKISDVEIETIPLSDDEKKPKKRKKKDSPKKTKKKKIEIDETNYKNQDTELSKDILNENDKKFEKKNQDIIQKIPNLNASIIEISDEDDILNESLLNHKSLKQTNPIVNNTIIIEKSFHTPKKMDLFKPEIFYINESDNHVYSKEESKVGIYHGELCFKIKIIHFKEDDSIHTKVKIEKIENVEGKYIYFCWIKDKDATENSKDLFEFFGINENVQTPLSASKRRKKIIFDDPKISKSIIEDKSTRDGASNLNDNSKSLEEISIKNKKRIENTKDNDNINECKNTQSISNFEIILLIDNREKTSQTERTYFHKNLTKKGIKCEKRTLEVGDFMWIAYNKEKNEEIVLDFIVERKAIDDLASSIIDKRYEEQKFRLNKSGLKNKYYIVEGDVKKASNFNNIEMRLKSAMISIQLDGFFLKQTKDTDQSIIFLELLTKEIIELSKDGIDKVSGKKQNLIDFSEFVSKDNLTDSEIFGKQLASLKNMSGSKAQEIIKLYPSPKDLVREFENHGEYLLENIKVNGIRIGSKLSKMINDLYLNGEYKDG